MSTVCNHTFHIPVMGLAFTIDTPIKVARYGISSVISIVDDVLTESMREYYAAKAGEAYTPITAKDEDFRARRITAYIDLVKRIVDKQVQEMQRGSFEEGSDLARYFQLLPESSPVKQLYNTMLATTIPEEKEAMCQQLREEVRPGAINVNIMTKVDKANFTAADEALPPEFSDALAALRGFAQSTVESAVVLSAGMNPRLYSYIEQFSDFFPDANGRQRKEIILKVSDYRSAYIQGKMLAKKGLWVSEFRIESGLNCGGHAFATEGLLLGPILEQFKNQRNELYQELLGLYHQALTTRGIVPPETLPLRITVQGGIGTTEEHSFLIGHYNVDSTGWGSPFLLVPEATTVDDDTLQLLCRARRSDYYTSDISPLGVPFNTVRGTSSEQQKLQRIEAGRPGSPCIKKYLASNTEFTNRPICVGSRQYQALKIQQLQQQDLSPEAYRKEYNRIVVKDCLCEGLASSALITTGTGIGGRRKRSNAVLLCPGPNLGYFSGIRSLEDMIGHIYGRKHLHFSEERPHMFINELNLYVEYLNKKAGEYVESPAAGPRKYIESFRNNLLIGIAYYAKLAGDPVTAHNFDSAFPQQLRRAEEQLRAMPFFKDTNCTITENQ